MELTQVTNNIERQIISEQEIITSRGCFIEANTEQVTLNHLKRDCIIPVYSDNETSLAHSEFIEATKEVVAGNFSGAKILEPNIRISHTIRGRVPTAINKTIKELNPEEKTIYYQRCAFMIEVPSIIENVNNNNLTLVIGGVRALNQENLYTKRNLERFQVCIGFSNKICTNLCLSSDGLNIDIRVSSVDELKHKIHELISSFDRERFLGNMERLSKFYLNEQEFANVVGKMKMYQHLPRNEKVDKLPLGMNDNQIGAVVKEYYNDLNFSRNKDKEINLFDFYNLMTGANKSSYIDSNLERNAKAFEFMSGLGNSIQNNSVNWFLN